MENGKPKLTPTEERIYKVLRDCRPHSRNEILRLLADDLAGKSTVRFHVSNLRRKINDQIILFVAHRAYYYVLVSKEAILQDVG